MSEHAYTVRVDVRYALWPGGAALCTRISGAVFRQDLFQLIDAEGRPHELRPYRVGDQLLEPRR